MLYHMARYSKLSQVEKTRLSKNSDAQAHALEHNLSIFQFLAFKRLVKVSKSQNKMQSKDINIFLI